MNKPIINLVTFVNILDVGINIGTEKIAIKLYVDDLALLTENDHDLQLVLKKIHDGAPLND